jgi:hypothetical protein
MAALLNSVTSKGPLNRAHTYKAAVVANDRELVLDHVLEPAGSTTCPGPTIAEHLDVSISTICLVVTAYALGIAVGSDGPIGRADQTATRPPSMCSAVAWM